jgi:AGZA family xanthine/uracil permease-like MFS transporter
VAAGIGLFIGLIGLKNGGLVVNSPATGLALGNFRRNGPILALVGLVLVVVLHVWRVNAAILIAIAATTVLAWVVGAVSFDVKPYSIASMTETVGKLAGGRLGFGGKAGLGIFEILFVFLFVDLFDNLGTLMAVTRRAGLIEPAGDIPGLNRCWWPMLARRWRARWARSDRHLLCRAPAGLRSADARA